MNSTTRAALLLESRGYDSEAADLRRSVSTSIRIGEARVYITNKKGKFTVEVGWPSSSRSVAETEAFALDLEMAIALASEVEARLIF